MGRMNVERQPGVSATNIDYLGEQGNFQDEEKKVPLGPWAVDYKHNKIKWKRMASVLD